MYSDLIGKPFCDGGRGPECYDCWGLAREMFARHEVELPDFGVSCKDHSGVSKMLRGQERNWIPIKEPCEPCIVIFRCDPSDRKLVTHMGVYVGNGRFVHAHEKYGVAVERLEHPYWKRAFYGFYKPGGGAVVATD